MGDLKDRRPTLTRSHSFPSVVPELRAPSDDDGRGSSEETQTPHGMFVHPLSPSSSRASRTSRVSRASHTSRDNVSEKKAADNEKKGAQDTLIDAALDHADAQVRNVRFQEQVVKSAALVERMMGMPLKSDDASHKLERFSSLRRPSERPADWIDADERRDTLGDLTGGGGSVLASLMKLEAQRRLSEQQNLKRRKETKENTFLAPSKAQATIQGTEGRPHLTNRPYSWFSSSHLVPSLENRIKATPSASRRTSVDSLFTTASQFEPITLEDRIRITFEIANILQKQEFLRKLLKCLMLYGCPAHRLEHIMRQVSATLNVDAEYVNMPNIMLMSVFDPATHTTETHFIRQTQGFDMHKLGEIYRLERLVAHGEVSIDEALDFIQLVIDEEPFYPVWLNPFVYGLASFCGCVMFFGGVWRDGGLAAALAMMFAVYELFSRKIQNFQPIWEVTMCIIVGFVTQALTKFSFCFTSVAFSSIIVILPGYSMAVAIIELVSRQLVSGVVRMVFTIVYSFLLGYGIQMGSALYRTIDPSAATATDVCPRSDDSQSFQAMVDLRFFVLLVPLFAVAYCIYVRARPVRWPVMILVSAIGYVVNFALSRWTKAPDQVLQVAPAFTIGFIGNVLSRVTGIMSFDAVLLGVLYLVPGGLGIKAGYGMFDTSNNGSGGEAAGFALAMIESSIGITLGLFVATLIVYPRGSRTPLMTF